jgi:hypothetical protein
MGRFRPLVGFERKRREAEAMNIKRTKKRANAKNEHEKAGRILLIESGPDSLKDRLGE